MRRILGLSIALALVPPALAAGGSAITPSWLERLSHEGHLDLPELDPGIPSPARFLGHPLGSRFHSQGEIVGYLEALCAVSGRATLWKYGTTYEDRPLVLMAISSPENLRRLERIRQEHTVQIEEDPLRPREQAAAARQSWLARAPAVVWLAYGIHGNEPSTSEAALALAYVLVAGADTVAASLKETIVLLDPLSNPDGRARYVEGYRSRRGKRPNPDLLAAEHWEPWPGGRFNHYMIDLNRDWAWASQDETQARLKAYRRWEPQVYVDFHEMSASSTYFFPPPADPIHPAINPRILDWLRIFGRQNAQAFDRLGWTYLAEKQFDLFYPGYGDSYPSLRGAVGMTYEVAGGGRAGEQVRLKDGRLLTLADRIARHLTTSIATVATAARHRRALLEDFLAGRLQASTDAPRSYLWEADQAEANALADLLTRHGIHLEQLGEPAELEVHELAGGAALRRAFAPGTFVVSTAQPLGSLVRSLMDLEAPMSSAFLDAQRRRIEDNRTAEFYDITAWSLPVAYNVDTWSVEGEVRGIARDEPGAPGGLTTGGRGLLVPPGGLAWYRFAAGLMETGIGYRVALDDVLEAGTRFPAGTLLIPRTGNFAKLDSIVRRLSQETGLTPLPLPNSLARGRAAFDSRQSPLLRLPRVGLVGGRGVDPNSFGFLWHLLDQDIQLPLTHLDLARISALDLSRFDVLILPHLEDSQPTGAVEQEAVRQWVLKGGTLIAIRSAVSWAQEQGLTSVKAWRAPSARAPTVSPSDKSNRVSLQIPGAALRTRMADGHPLVLGLTRAPAVLFSGSDFLLPTGDPRIDVLRATVEEPVLAGFAWPEAETRLRGTLLVASETRGAGRVILFAQDPAFRLFWRGTTSVLLNAVMLAPNLTAP